jgi:hypothetical protein
MKLMSCDLRESRVVTLPVVLHADQQQNRSVRQHSRGCRLVTGDYSRFALHPFGLAVAALLSIEGEADTDYAAVRFAGQLAPTHRRQINHGSRGFKRGNVIAGVKRHAGSRLIGELGHRHDILTAQIDGLTAELACHFLNQPLDGKASARSRYPAIGPKWRFVGRDRERVEL